MAGHDGERALQVVHLLGGEQLGVVEGIAGDGQPPALDGVGEDNGGAGEVLLDEVEGFDEGVQVMAAKVAQDTRQIGIGDVRHDRQDGVTAGAGKLPQTQAAFGPGERDEGLVVFVVHVVDAAAKLCAALPPKQVLQQVAILDLEYTPAAFGEETLELGGADARHDAV